MAWRKYFLISELVWKRVRLQHLWGDGFEYILFGSINEVIIILSEISILWAVIL